MADRMGAGITPVRRNHHLLQSPTAARGLLERPPLNPVPMRACSERPVHTTRLKWCWHWLSGHRICWTGCRTFVEVARPEPACPRQLDRVRCECTSSCRAKASKLHMVGNLEPPCPAIRRSCRGKQMVAFHRGHVEQLPVHIGGAVPLFAPAPLAEAIRYYSLHEGSIAGMTGSPDALSAFKIKTQFNSGLAQRYGSADTLPCPSQGRQAMIDGRGVTSDWDPVSNAAH
jgi:hypothetical protein